MKRVGIEEFGDQVSAFVRAASAGEVVLVTEGDRVVAELTPPRHGLSAEDAFVEMGRREGWLTPAECRGPPPSMPLPDSISLDDVLKGLADDRADR